MIIFDQLKVSDDGKRMYINAHVNKASYFDNVYIDSIVIMTSDKVSEVSPEMPTEDYIYRKEIIGEEKELNLVLEAADFVKVWEEDPKAMSFNNNDMSKTLFFVYIKCKGTPGECVPCRLDEETTLGVVFDEAMLYQKIMGHTKDLLADCTVPTAFIDFILLWNAFRAAIETEHYGAAIKFYNMLFGTGTDAGYYNVTKECGCHG